MNNNLDNKSMSRNDTDSLESAIDEMKERLDQRHPIERKVQFFLDIRGYLKLNAIRGSYVEFGSFRSWTQFAAYQLLEHTGMIHSYVGLDAFIGEPTPSPSEASHMPVMVQGDFHCPYEEILEFVTTKIGSKGHLIKGDFREPSVMDQVTAHCPVSLAVIDCNLVSSLEASTRFVMEHATPGCAVFVDDNFTNFGKGEAVIPDMCARIATETGWKIIEHSFYAPFAKSFILAR